MTPQAGENHVISLSTKITVIVFWGLILVGIIFSAILFQNMGVTTQETRDALADNISYQIHEALDLPEFIEGPELQNQLYLLSDLHPELYIVVRKGKDVLASAGQPDNNRDGQTIKKVVRFTEADGQRQSVALAIHFPKLEDTLHSQRTPLLIGLGVLLLVFGSVIKGLLDRILTNPLGQMVATAKAISEGKTDENPSFDDTRDDEFGYVATFINEALLTMRTSQESAWDAKELAEVTLHSIGDSVITTDREGRVVLMSPVAEKTLGVSLENSKGDMLKDIMFIIDEETGKSLENPITQCLRENKSIEIEETCAILRSDDAEHPVEITASPISGKNGKVHGAVIVLHDVREARALQRELSYQASHDPLTGLYNRREFERVLQRALEHTKRENEEHALCYLDLDQFKIVNDTCGHAAGDLLLQKLTTYLHSKLRKSDVFARLGGDEFGLLLTHCSIKDATEIADNIRREIKEFIFVWQDKSFQVGVSIGLVPLKHDQNSVAEILSAADMACYVAKEDGRNRIHIYQPDDEDMHRRRNEMGMVSAVRQALIKGRFELFAQPIVAVDGEKTTHYELLIRMLDKELAYIPPGAFIPAAERYQLMSDIDRWVINESIKLLLEQEQAGRNIFISINVSGQSIGESNFLQYVTGKVDELGDSANRICFEITETVAVNNIGLALTFIETMKRYGCKFALDDFGAGVSSFGYLKNLPVDYVKIDGVFIRSIHDNKVDQAMVEAIAQVCRVMGMQTIAEFVENEESFEILQQMGIDYAQGYWIDKPKPISEVFPTDKDEDIPALRLLKTN